MTRIALITTTINVPTVLTQWVKSGMTEDDVIIVAGDQKSPHEEILQLLNDIMAKTNITCRYLFPDVQDGMWSVSGLIGWNCIQRRNIALLEALLLEPKYILTIDDDNAPTSTRQIEHLFQIMEGMDHRSPVVHSSTGWYNPGRHCLTDELRHVVHRGFPLRERFIKPFYTYHPNENKPIVGVAAMLWTGEPDIDAVERIAVHPNVTRLTRDDVILTPGTWAPFNTQATIFRAELGPAMFMLPHVGRYDDIWASYVTRKVMDRLGWGHYVGSPAVHQDRNEHDLVSDLQAEMFGMRHNHDVIDTIQRTRLRENDTILGDVAEIYIDLQDMKILPPRTQDAMHAWSNDIERIQRG